MGKNHWREVEESSSQRCATMEERESKKMFKKIGRSVEPKGKKGHLKRCPENLAVGLRFPQGR